VLQGVANFGIWTRGPIAFALATIFVAAAPAAADTRIVATTSDLAQFANAVGENLVIVDTLVPPASDAEAFEPRPGDLGKLRRADLVVRVGLGYDGWLDKLLFEAGNARVMRGAAGYVDGSVGIPLLDVRSQTIANDGSHAHAAANPHYWLDPQNAVIVSGGIAEALIARLPDQRDRIVANRDRFLQELKRRLAAWTEIATAFAGAKFIAYHNSWPYFARRFRLNVVDFIELKPGIAPSPSHIAQLVSNGRKMQVRAILHEPYEPGDSPRFLAERLSVPVVTLAPSVGSMPGADSYFALFDLNLAAIATAFAKPR
jgi:ABC-type Zn uptake system ZnuABC Zn-binding protein ZnuA